MKIPKHIVLTMLLLLSHLRGSGILDAWRWNWLSGPKCR